MEWCVCVAGKIDRLWEVKTPVKGATHVPETICSVVPYMVNGKLKGKHQYYGQIQLGMLLLSTTMCDFTLYCYTPKKDGVHVDTDKPHKDGVYVDTVVFNDKFCLEYVRNLTNAYFTYVLPWLASQDDPAEP